MKYKAFISYKHEVSSTHAQKIESALKSYAKPLYQPPIKIFRDEVHLVPGNDLPASIREAMNESEYMLLLASKEAAESQWVQDEIDTWCGDLKRTENLIIVLTKDNIEINNEGQLEKIDWDRTNALPVNLRKYITQMPLYSDLRWAKNEDDFNLNNTDFKNVINRITARFRGIDPNDMLGEEVLQHKRNLRIRNTAISILTILLLISVIGGVYSFWQRNIAEQQAELSFSREMAAFAQNERTVNHDLSLLLSVLSNSNKIKTLESKSALLDSITHLPYISKYLWGANSPDDIDFSPDGKILATGDDEGTVLLWDVDTGKIIGEPLLGHRNWILAVKFSPDGKFLATGARNGEIILWDLEKREIVGEPITGHHGDVLDLEFTPDSKILISASSDGDVLYEDKVFSELVTWQVNNMEMIGDPLIGPQGSASNISIHPDGKTLATVVDGEVYLWDIQERVQLKNRPQGHDGEIQCVSFSPDGKKLATGALVGQIWSGDEYGEVIIWDRDDFKQLGKPMKGHITWVYDVEFSADSKILASVGQEELILWDVDNNKMIGEPIKGHDGYVYSLSVSQADNKIATADHEDLFILWDYDKKYKTVSRLESMEKYVDGLAFSPDYKVVAYGMMDGSIFLRDLDSGEIIGDPFVGHGGSLGDPDNSSVGSLAFSPDGNFLASGGEDGLVILWDIKEEKNLGEPIVGHTDWVENLVFNQDGSILLTQSLGEEIIIWDVVNNKIIKELEFGSKMRIRESTYNADLSMAAFGTKSGEIILWDLNKNEIVETLVGHEGLSASSDDKTIQALTFGPDGEFLASTGVDKQVIVWDINNRMMIGEPLVGHNDRIYTVEFIPKENYLISADRDGFIIIWDLDKQEMVGNPIKMHDFPIFKIQYDKESNTLFSVSDSGEINRWKIDLDSWLEAACSIANRNFSLIEWEKYQADNKNEKVCKELDVNLSSIEDNSNKELALTKSDY